jgi:TRAP-type C4-dicarboxylate transport system permease small subunit
VTSKLSAATRARLFAATSTLVAAICVFISYWGFVVTYDFYLRGMVSENVLSIPRWIILVCIPIGFGLTAIEFARLAFYRGEGLPATEEAALDPSRGDV